MSYPTTLLVSAAWLNERVNDDALVILDVRSAAAYAKGHLPNARSLSLGHCRSAAESLPEGVDTTALALQLGALGVSPTQTVVLYDDQLSQSATLGFWALEHIGQGQVHILEGGVAAWTEAEMPMSQTTPTYPAVPYTVTLRPTRSHADDLTATHPYQLVDVRGIQEYHAAHIEGATHCCWTELVQDLYSLTLLPAATIADKLTALGITADHDIITYCRSGARGSFVYFILRLLGWEQVRLYDGSMNDWLLREHPTVAG